MLDLIYIASYLVVLLVLISKDAFVAFFAALFCCAFAASRAFDSATGEQVHLVYLVCYLVFSFSISYKYTKYAMLFMAVFDTIMAWDAYKYADVQTWLYNNYTLNTSLIHAIIVCSLVFRRENIKVYNNFINSLRKLFGSANDIQHDGQLSCSKDIKGHKV